ncbi:MAG: amino acid ABC transporter permease [Clostridia bacterium]|nr:amino acid ABC transporter permease [Clostridia bacterium]
MINYTYRLLGCGQSVLYGAKLTIFLTFISMISGLFLAIFLALGKISKYKIISKPCSAYIFFFRGTPLMIQIFCIYLAVPGIFEGFTWRGVFSSSDPEAVFKGAFLAAFIAFTLNNAAYCAEIVRAAILSIDKGQNEAAKALGLSYAQTMRLVILPQSVARLIPPVANEFIMILKDASLVFVIGLQDITTISKSVSANGDYLVFVPALVIYLIITAFFSFVFTKLEKRFSAYLR